MKGGITRRSCCYSGAGSLRTLKMTGLRREKVDYLDVYSSSVPSVNRTTWRETAGLGYPAAAWPFFDKTLSKKTAL